MPMMRNEKLAELPFADLVLMRNYCQETAARLRHEYASDPEGQRQANTWSLRAKVVADEIMARAIELTGVEKSHRGAPQTGAAKPKSDPPAKELTAADEMQDEKK